jgi:hypothetical protein
MTNIDSQIKLDDPRKIHIVEFFLTQKKKTKKKNKCELLFRANSPSFYFLGHAIHQLHNANDLFSSLDFVSFVLLSFRKNLSNNYFEQNLNI